jgi:hypothetical protein
VAVAVAVVHAKLEPMLAVAVFGCKLLMWAALLLLVIGPPYIFGKIAIEFLKLKLKRKHEKHLQHGGNEAPKTK